MTDGSAVIYQDDCLYQSTALERALAAVTGKVGGKRLVLQLDNSGAWQTLGTLGELERTTWIRFEVSHARPAGLPVALEHLRNRIQGLSTEVRQDQSGHISMLFPQREEARSALQQAEREFPGFSWSERSDH